MDSINDLVIEAILGMGEGAQDIRVVVIYSVLTIFIYIIKWLINKRKNDANIEKTNSESGNIDAVTISSLIESVGKLQKKSDEQHETNDMLRLRMLDIETENKTLIEKIRNIEEENTRLSFVNESNQKKIEALETENGELRQIMTDTGLENKRIKDRLTAVTSGVRKLHKQIESMGHTPAFRLEDEQL